MPAVSANRLMMIERIVLVIRSICLDVLPSKNSSVLTGCLDSRLRVVFLRNSVDSCPLLQ